MLRGLKLISTGAIAVGLINLLSAAGADDIGTAGSNAELMAKVGFSLICALIGFGLGAIVKGVEHGRIER